MHCCKGISNNASPKLREFVKDIYVKEYKQKGEGNGESKTDLHD